MHEEPSDKHPSSRRAPPRPDATQHDDGRPGSAARAERAGAALRATLARVAASLVPGLADLCTIDLVDDEGVPRRATTAHRDPGKLFLARELEALYPPDATRSPVVVEALRTGAPLLQQQIDDEALVRSATSDEHLLLLRELSPRSSIVVPLSARGRLLGLARLTSSDDARAFTSDDLERAASLLQSAAVAIDDARRRDEEGRGASSADAYDLELDERLAFVLEELQAPVVALSLRLQMMTRAAARGADPAAWRKVEEQAGRLARMFDEMIEASRMRAGALRLRRAPCDLAEIVDDAVAAARPVLDRAGCHVFAEIERGAQGRFDASRLSQAVGKLLSNAARYGPGKPVRVALRVLGDRARLVVEDHGTGVAPADRARVFEVRTGPYGSARLVGSSLGLFLVREIVRAHGGRIEVDGAFAQGARFTLELPLAQDA